MPRSKSRSRSREKDKKKSKSRSKSPKKERRRSRSKSAEKKTRKSRSRSRERDRRNETNGRGRAAGNDRRDPINRARDNFRDRDFRGSGFRGRGRGRDFDRPAGRFDRDNRFGRNDRPDFRRDTRFDRDRPAPDRAGGRRFSDYDRWRNEKGDRDAAPRSRGDVDPLYMPRNFLFDDRETYQEEGSSEIEPKPRGGYRRGRSPSPDQWGHDKFDTDEKKQENKDENAEKKAEGSTQSKDADQSSSQKDSREDGDSRDKQEDGSSSKDGGAEPGQISSETAGTSSMSEERD